MIIVASIEPLKKAYSALFKSAKLPDELSEILIKHLTEQDGTSAILSAEQKEKLALAVFAPQDVASVASALFSYPDFILYLSGFLTTFLPVKQYNAIFYFFNKAFVSRIGTTPFTSRNSKDFDMAERTFDRFIEAVHTCGVLENSWMPMLFAILESEAGEPMLKWKRPVYDYLFDTAHSNERDFVKSITANFGSVGIGAFRFAIGAGIEGATTALVTNYLSDERFRTREVWTLIKQNPNQAVAYLIECIDTNQGERKDIVDALIAFKMHEGVAGKLAEVYFKEKSPAIRKAIIEHINIPVVSSVNQEQQLIALADKFGRTPSEPFLGLNYDSFPPLILASGMEASRNVAGFMLFSYKSLPSSRAFLENAFFTQLLTQESLNKFCKFVFDRVLDDGFSASNEWAMLLVVQNADEALLKSLLNELCSYYDESVSDGFAVFMSLIALTRPEFVLGCADVFNAFPKSAKDFRAVLIRAAATSGKYSQSEVETLKDKLTPTFKLNANLGYEYKLLAGIAELRIKDDTTIEVIYPAGVSEDTLDSNSKREINDIKEAMRAELVKQLNRLYMAYETGKKWSIVEFKTQLENHLFASLAERLLWGKYKNGKLLAVSCISAGRMSDVTQRENAFDTDFVIGVLHPMEYEASEYLANNVKQPPAFNQVIREVFYKEAYKPQGSVVLKFNGLFIRADGFVSKIIANSWVLGLKSHDGRIVSFLRRNYELDIVAELCCSPISTTPQNEDATLGELRFYKLADMSEQGQAEKSRSLSLHAVPDRFFSNILYELVTASRK